LKKDTVIDMAKKKSRKHKLLGKHKTKRKHKHKR